MKISNIKFSKKIAYTLISVITALLIGELYVNTPIIYLFITVILASQVYFFFKLKSTVIELSGGCLTVRKNHPLSFKKFINPDFELPYSRVLGFKIIRKLGIRNLKLKFNSKRQNKLCLNISLLGFEKQQNIKLKSSLLRVINPNSFDNRGVDPTLKTVA